MTKLVGSCRLQFADRSVRATRRHRDRDEYRVASIGLRVFTSCELRVTSCEWRVASGGNRSTGEDARHSMVGLGFGYGVGLDVGVGIGIGTYFLAVTRSEIWSYCACERMRRVTRSRGVS